MLHSLYCLVRHRGRGVQHFFERIMALIALLLLLPLMLFIVLLIRVDSPGPALFLQQRLGRGGRYFKLYKFRTMAYLRSESGPTFTLAHDKRLTRVGQMLRHYKLDEMPQLWNICLGDMAFVGPRPIVKEQVELYSPDKLEVMYSVHPGVTGPATLHFRHESKHLSEAQDPEEYWCSLVPVKESMGCAYVEDKSLWLDIKIVLRTILSIWR